MRLRRLDLARYGRFTDRTIDFGEAAPGMPDLHVIHGPNEAGKSTLLAGFLDLLFGIELQSRYGFLHPYETMRVGGCLELAGGRQELVRIKKPQPTLRDADNQPVSPLLLAGELGGLDRAAYRTMFSLDDETLELGGESILASNGELGQLLFSASAGLAELSRTLLDIRSDAHDFTWANARSGELHRLKETLEKLKQERDAIDTRASAYAQLAKARDLGTQAYQAALAELADTKGRHAQIQRLRSALPRLAALRGFQERLAGFAGLPAVPAGWQAELATLEQAGAGHRTRMEGAAAEVKRLAEALGGIEVDEAALARSGRLRPLDAHAARYATAALDLAPVGRELARADEAISGLLARLGRNGEADPGQLLLSEAQAAVFDALMRTRSGIETRLADANRELVDAADGLSECRQALGADAQAPPAGAMAFVTAALAAFRASDHTHRLRTAAQARDRDRGALEQRLEALRPWSGDAAALAGLVLPGPETTEGWLGEAARCAGLVAERERDVERLRAELAPREAELAAIGAAAGLSSDAEAAELRTAREAAWARHRRSLDTLTADAFEAALRKDDLAGAARLGHERELAKLHETARDVHGRQAALTAATLALAEARSGKDSQASLMAEAISAASPALAGLSAPAWAAWVGRRSEALACRQDLRDAEREMTQAREAEAALCHRLHDALMRACLSFELQAAADVLAVAAQDGLNREARRLVLQATLDDCEKNLRARETAVERAAHDDVAWRSAWLAACSGCWLGAAAATAPFETIRAILNAAKELGPALAARRSLADRIEGMQDDQARFEGEVDRLAAELGLAANGASHVDLARAIADRVQGATRAAAECTRLRDALAKARETERDALQAATAHTARVGEMQAALQAGSLIEVAGKLRDIKERDGLVAQAAAAEREILAGLEIGSLEGAQALLDGRSGSALDGDEAALASELEDLQQRSRTLFADLQLAHQRIDAVGGDDAAARIEERRRTQMLEIEDKAGRYLRLRVGIAAADRALRAYRDQHRSAMMLQASDAFSQISRGAYRGLATQPGKEGDILVALGADGGSKLAADLSKGTRFQLYLALRAAGYREFARLRPTVPFVADDIMETFDDFRAEETLRVLGDMSRLGQVIYLTHHGHLRDIAQRTVPGLRLHELAP